METADTMMYERDPMDREVMVTLSLAALLEELGYLPDGEQPELEAR